MSVLGGGILPLAPFWPLASACFLDSFDGATDGKRRVQNVWETFGELINGDAAEKDLPGMFPGISLILASSTNCGLWSRSWPTIASSSILRKYVFLTPEKRDQCAALRMRNIRYMLVDVSQAKVTRELGGMARSRTVLVGRKRRHLSQK